LGTDEAVIMPMPVFERNKLCTADAGNRLHTGIASFREQIPIAIGAIWVFVFGGETLAGQRLMAVCAAEAFPMPGLILIRHTTGCDNLFAFGASCGELFLIAPGAENILVFRDETFRANGRLAMRTAETFIMPLFAFVFHLLHTGSEDLIATVASGGESLIVTVGAEDPIIFGAERLVDQGDLAHIAQETVLMPVLVLVG